VGRVAAAEPFEQEGEVQSRWTRGSTGAPLERVMGFGAAGHMAALEPFRAGRWGPEL
jgi:hypothetical protein